jgi:hypothetical protein
MKKLFCIIFITVVVFTIQSCSKHGNKLSFNNGELYYTESVQKSDAEKLGSYLQNEGFFNGEKRTVQLNKNGKTWEFRMVVKEGTENDDQYINLFGFFSLQLSKAVFDNQPVDIHLCNNELETLKVIPFKVIESENKAH